LRYLINHWHGELPLQISFWVNLIGLLVILAVVESMILLRFSHDTESMVKATFISLVITRLIIFPWQLIGLIRSSDRHFLQYRNGYLTRLVYVMIVLSVLYTLLYIIGTLQTVFIYKKQMDAYSQVDQHGFTLSLHQNAQLLKIDGALDIGITRKVREIIQRNPEIKTVLLNSPGGQIYQGRGLARLIMQHHLNTQVEIECSSSCVTAFIAGQKRSLGSRGKLGFHQYRFDTTQTKRIIPLYESLLIEQQRDLELFKQQGVRDEFLRIMFQQSADDIWFPPPQQLLAAGVIHQLITRN
jgi:hypothetical protein